MSERVSEREREREKIVAFGKTSGIKLSREKMIDETFGRISEIWIFFVFAQLTGQAQKNLSEFRNRL